VLLIQMMRRSVLTLDREYYETPPWVTWRLLEVLSPLRIPRVTMPLKGIQRNQRWLDPCCGDGAITRVLTQYADTYGYSTVKIVPIDVHKSEVYPHRVNDFLACYQGLDLFDLCIMKPSILKADRFVDAALQISRCVCALLPTSYFLSNRGRKLVEDRMPDVYVLPCRPWENRGQYAWFVWPMWIRSRQVGAITMLPTTPLSERKGGENEQASSAKVCL
jgi:hypothetical protein